MQARSGARTSRSASSASTARRTSRVQRIGLSATQRPLEEIGRFVSGGRPIELVDAGRPRSSTSQVVVPVEDMREPGRRSALSSRRRGQVTGRRAARGAARSIWPSIYPELLRLVERAPLDDRLRQQPAARGAARAAPERARRGGDRARAPWLLAREQRGRDRGASESGADPVPRRHVVARARHRHGRRRPRDPGRVAEVGRARAAADRPRRATSCSAVSKGRIFPKFRADLLESAVVARRDARAARSRRR